MVKRLGVLLFSHRHLLEMPHSLLVPSLFLQEQPQRHVYLRKVGAKSNEVLQNLHTLRTAILSEQEFAQEEGGLRSVRLQSDHLRQKDHRLFGHPRGLGALAHQKKGLMILRVRENHFLIVRQRLGASPQCLIDGCQIEVCARVTKIEDYGPSQVFLRALQVPTIEDEHAQQVVAVRRVRLNLQHPGQVGMGRVLLLVFDIISGQRQVDLEAIRIPLQCFSEFLECRVSVPVIRVFC